MRISHLKPWWNSVTVDDQAAYQFNTQAGTPAFHPKQSSPTGAGLIPCLLARRPPGAGSQGLPPGTCSWGHTRGRARPAGCGAMGARAGGASASPPPLSPAPAREPGARGDAYLGRDTPPQSRLATQGQLQVAVQPALVQEASPVAWHGPGRRGLRSLSPGHGGDPG
jgi:hypothetical protein